MIWETSQSVLIKVGIVYFVDMNCSMTQYSRWQSDQGRIFQKLATVWDGNETTLNLRYDIAWKIIKQCVIVKIMIDYDYIYSVIDYDYLATGNGNSDFLRSYNQLQFITITPWVLCDVSLPPHCQQW